MRIFLRALFVLTILVTFARPADAAAPVLVRLSADRVQFYYDRFLIEADGHVRVQASNGLVATGDAFSMDLKLNRYVLAGHVTLRTSSGSASGAAIADFLDFDRIYFVPVTSEPDRWTFLNGDLAHPVKGRIMPGDVFYFPQLPEYPSLSATGAVIGTKTYVRFLGAQANFGGASIPMGSYVVNFSPNQYFAQNSLSGANLDATWNFAGNSNTLSALHVRYDTQNYLYTAFEQHVVGGHEYAIFSVNPFSRAGKYYNLQLYDRLSDRLQLQTFSQVYTYQYNLSAPQAATQTTYLEGTYAFAHSYLSAVANLTNYNMLGINPLLQEIRCQVTDCATVKAGAGSLSHPSALQINLSSFQNRIGKTPFYEQIYGGYGFNHDTVGPDQYLQGCREATCGLPSDPWSNPNPVPGLQAYGAPCNYFKYSSSSPPPTYFCPVYTTIWNAVAGFNLYATSIPLFGDEGPNKTFYLNASLNEQEQWNSLPHRIRQTIAAVSLSRQFARQVNSYLSYGIQNTGDYYLRGGYATCTPGPLCPPGLDTFRGVATWRTLSLGINYVPSPEFNFSVLARHHADFPEPAPNFYAQPPNNVLGQPLYTTYLGQPPNDIAGDVRFKLLPHMLIDVSRTYYFHYGSQNWSPQTIVQVLPI